MTTVNPIAEVIPNGTVASDVARQKLAAATPLVLQTAASIEEMDFQAVNAVAVPWVVTLEGVDYTRYPAGDGGESVDGVTLVAESGECYRAEISSRAFVNVLDIVDEPPVDAVPDDRYIASAAPTGEFADGANKLYVLTTHGWEGTLAEIGFSTFVLAEDSRYYYAASGEWKPGDGADAGSIGPHELEKPWGMVAMSETATPPGTRALGATPTMPLGGTAANINDDTAATTATTAALGNLTGAAVGARIFSKLDLGADVVIAAIQAKQLRASAGTSTANAMGFYYATAAAPTTWVQFGAGFTLTAALADYARSGEATARYVAIATEAKDWAAATHIIGDFNAYKLATTLLDGTLVIVAANGIGAFSGQDTKIAEARDGAFRFYTPYENAEIFDDGIGIKRRFESGAWIGAAGVWVADDIVKTPGTGSVADLDGAPSGLCYTYSNTVAPTTSHMRFRDEVGLNVTAIAGSRLRFQYDANVSYTTNSGLPSGGAFMTAALLRDDTTVIDWKLISNLGSFADGAAAVASMNGNKPDLHVVFDTTAVDGGLHTYKVAIFSGFLSTTYIKASALGRRTFQVEVGGS